VTGPRVRQVRELLGWSQQELADRAGVSQAAIHQAETGLLWTQPVTQAIAGATGFPVEFLERTPPDEFPEGSIRYRKKCRASKKDDRMAVRRLELVAELVTNLAEGLRTPPVTLYYIGPPTDPADSEEAARETRAAMGVAERGPINHLVRAAERSGVIVVGLSVDFSVPGRLPHHHGVSAWPDLALRPVIGFSTLDSGDRQRHTVAHEIGHLVCHRGVVDPDRDYEREASAFAGALLMPHPDATEAFDSGPITLRRLVSLKQIWGVSVAALIMRAQQVGAIGPDRVTSLFKQISSRGWRTQEPILVRREQPAFLPQLLKTSQRRKDVDWIAAGHAYGIPPMLLRELACVPIEERRRDDDFAAPSEIGIARLRRESRRTGS